MSWIDKRRGPRIKAPRLFLRQFAFNRKLYYILDRGKQISTGISSAAPEAAADALRRYIVEEASRSSRRRARAEARQRRQEAKAGFIYFISAEGQRRYPIKVGYTAGPTVERVAGLQTGCPYPLVVVGVMRGHRFMETDILRKFKRHRLTGEWLKRTKALESFIRANSIANHCEATELLAEISS